MRLLYLGDTVSPHFRAWPEHFAARGHEVHALHLARGPEGPPLPGVTMHPRPAALRSRLRGAWLLAGMSARSLARRLRPDVSHSHQVIPAGYLTELGGVAPHVATAWGSEVLLARSGGGRLVARVARGAELLTADSHHLLAALERAGADPARLRWVPWGVAAEWRRPALGLGPGDAAAAAGLSDAVPFALFHRGVRGLYRPGEFVEALAALRARGHQLNGVIVELGAGAPDADATLRDRIAALGLDDAVRFIPPVDHPRMAELLAAAELCVSIPETDSAPTSVFEALAVGTPAVVSDLPWVHEPVHREARLQVVPVGDAEALAEAMARVLDASAAEREADAAANLDLVERHFDRDRVFAEIEADYERLAAGGPA
jgi:glycosyltransferase involved in cell wall biosynthesis